MSPTNHAAVQREKAAPIVVEETSFPEPLPSEIVMKVTAIAINPVDWGIANLNFFNTPYPKVFGHDAAGIVEAIGEGVTSLKVGDRVFGFPSGDAKGNAYQTFQEYVKFCIPAITKTPNNITDAQASTISLCLGTAATSLFTKKHLGLELPPRDGSVAAAKNQTVLIWGGSSGVGAAGIQMLAAAGYDVVTTASSHNLELVKSLGASQAFDYKSPSIVDDIIASLHGKEVVGALAAIAQEQTIEALSKILIGADAKQKYIGSVKPGAEKFAGEGVGIAFVLGTDIRDRDGDKYIAEHLWEHWLPAAIENGNFKPTRPKVVGKGLKYVDTAMDAWKNGISAEKIVVEL